jgi:hypothetical protein
MDQRDIVSTLSGIQRKLADGSEISEIEVEQMAKAAAATGHIQHRALFAETKRINRDGPDKPAEPPVVEPVTAEEVAAARVKAKKTGLIKDRVAYVALKNRLDAE